MYPLPAHTVELVLQYISPLSDPLPPHLISTPLQQRHHFLQISPSTPVEYLCWPSPDGPETIELLDRLSLLSDHASYPTRYTSDPESTFAHVQISSNAPGLRMLFLWDDIHGWMYHDLRLMPFPSSSYSTPQESLASSSACGPGLPRFSFPKTNHVNSGDDDSYWDLYGDPGHDLASSSLPQGSTDAVQGEDAYWAQYACIQGSADSTIPSPLPVHRKLQPLSSTDDESGSAFPSQNDPIIDIPADALHSRPLASRAELPSPNMLAHLLSTISPRKEIYSPVHDDVQSSQSPSVFSTDPSPEQTTTDSELVTPLSTNRYLDVSVISPTAFKLNGVPPAKCCSHPQVEDTALANSIKGLYYLWRTERKEELDEKDKSDFLLIVQAAIARE